MDVLKKCGLFRLKVVVWPFEINTSSKICICTRGKIVPVIWVSCGSCSCLWHFTGGKHMLFFFVLNCVSMCGSRWVTKIYGYLHISLRHFPCLIAALKLTKCLLCHRIKGSIIRSSALYYSWAEKMRCTPKTCAAWFLSLTYHLGSSISAVTLNKCLQVCPISLK